MSETDDLREALRKVEAERDTARADTAGYAKMFDHMKLTLDAGDRLAGVRLRVERERHAALREAATARLAHGHNDTCGAVVSDGVAYPCSCGHDALRTALSAASEPVSAPEPQSGEAPRRLRPVVLSDGTHAVVTAEPDGRHPTTARVACEDGSIRDWPVSDMRYDAGAPTPAASAAPKRMTADVLCLKPRCGRRAVYDRGVAIFCEEHLAQHSEPSPPAPAEPRRDASEPGSAAATRDEREWRFQYDHGSRCTAPVNGVRCPFDRVRGTLFCVKHGGSAAAPDADAVRRAEGGRIASLRADAEKRDVVREIVRYLHDKHVAQVTSDGFDDGRGIRTGWLDAADYIAARWGTAAERDGKDGGR